MGQGHKFPGAFANQGNAATGTADQAGYLNAGANPMELLPGAPDPVSGGLPHLAVKVTLAATGGRPPLALPPAPFDQDHPEIAQWVGPRPPRQTELRRNAPHHPTPPTTHPR